MRLVLLVLLCSTLIVAIEDRKPKEKEKATEVVTEKPTEKPADTVTKDEKAKEETQTVRIEKLF